MHFLIAVVSKAPEDVEYLLNPYGEEPEDLSLIEFESAGADMDALRSDYEKHKKEGQSFADYLSDCGYEYDEKLDDVGFFVNPNAKWDWFEVGGRWSNELRLKPEFCVGQHPNCNCAKIKELDLEPDPEEYAKAERFWEVVVEGAALKEDEQLIDFKTCYPPDYFRKTFKSCKNYARLMSSTPFAALITSDGEWIDAGFCDHVLRINQLKDGTVVCEGEGIEPVILDPEHYLTMVDCHI